MRYNPQLHPRCERVTSRTAGYDCVNNATVRELKGGDPRTDQYEEGDDSDPGLASRRGCVLTAKAGPSAQSTPSFAQKPWGGRPPMCGRPADYLPSGDGGSVAYLPPWQWWNEAKGRRP